MLLRSASTPIIKPCSHHHDPSCEVHASIPSPGSWSPNQKNRAFCRALSETDLQELSSSKLKSTPNAYCSPMYLEDIESDESETASIGYSGGSGGESGGGGSEQGGGNDDENEIEVYYKNAIKENPRSGLILGNYARFLKEVKGDSERAKEYCERAILAKSSDGYVLALFGELIWETQRDSFRAKTYFDQAVQSAPDSCYVLASYARFVWDAEEEEDDEEGGNGGEEDGSLICGIEKAKIMGSFDVRPPLAAST